MDESHTVLGICHSGAEPADLQCLQDLLRPLPPFEDKKRYCCIFSTSGFSKELEENASKAKNVWLIDLEDITSS